MNFSDMKLLEGMYQLWKLSLGKMTFQVKISVININTSWTDSQPRDQHTYLGVGCFKWSSGFCLAATRLLDKECVCVCVCVSVCVSVSVSQPSNADWAFWRESFNGQKRASHWCLAVPQQEHHFIKYRTESWIQISGFDLIYMWLFHRHFLQ